MWTTTFGVLTTDVEVAAAGSVAATLRSVTATYGPPGGPASLSYRLETEPELRVWRNERVIAEVEDALDLVPLFELDLYRQLIERSAGTWLLHAAAVAENGVAAVLAGPSGAGKSTAALGLVARGARYLTDEYAAIDAGGAVSGVTRPIAFVGSEPAEAVPADFSSASYPIRHKSGEVVRYDVFHPPAKHLHHGPAPLRLLACIRYAPGEPPGARRLSVSQALDSLWACTMNPSADALVIATELLQRFPVYELVTDSVGRACEEVRALARI